MNDKALNRFLNDEGKVTVWPSKPSNKTLLLKYLVAKFDKNKTYSEKEVNEILRAWHTFEDWAVLRRALIDKGYMTRDLNGYKYKVTETEV
jgi:hypothetical protein